MPYQGRYMVVAEPSAVVVVAGVPTPSDGTWTKDAPDHDEDTFWIVDTMYVIRCPVLCMLAKGGET